MPGDAASQNAQVLRELRGLSEKWQDEVLASSRQLAELQLLLRQTATEIDRLAPRSGQAIQRLRDMEAHIESYTRTDIKDVYANAQEAQLRLFMMQLQQEQIEHKVRVLTAHRDAIATVITLAERVRSEGNEAEQLRREEAQASASAQEVLARIIQVQEDERRHVSRQIHDGPAQALANIVLRAEICERLLDKEPDAARGELLHLKKLVTDSLQETRHFIFDLRPMILDDLGLIPTLRRYCQLLAQSAGVPVKLDIAGAERRFPPASEIGMFRIIQEALRNALEHGQPGEVQVLLQVEPQMVRLSIRDDGRGCDSAAVLAASKQGRTVGLARMQEYARSLEASYAFESAPAEGCEVTVIVPLRPATS